jgi:hypothetical protein
VDRDPPHALRLARAALALGAAWALASAATADAGQGAATADLSWIRTDAGGVETGGFRQSYWADYRHTVAEGLRYDLTLRLNDERMGGETGGVAIRSESTTAAPSLDLRYLKDGFTARGAYDLLWSRSQLLGDGVAHTRSDHLTAATSYAVIEDVNLSAAVTRTTQSVAGFPDVSDTRTDLGASSYFGGFNVSQAVRFSSYDDPGHGYSRTGVEPRAGVQYQRDFAGKLTVGGSYTGSFSEIHEQLGSQSAIAAMELVPLGALYVQTNQPYDTSATPMTPIPALVDGSFGVATGVDLGPTGASFQNLGLDMGRFVVVDEVRVFVRTGAGAPVPSGGPISWTAFSSVDGVRWLPAAAALGAFDPAQSAYVVSFAPTNARYFKVVSFGLNSFETFATELQAFVHEAAQWDQLRVTRTVSQTAGARLSFKPTQAALISYSTSLSDARSNGTGTIAASSTDRTHALSATLGDARSTVTGAYAHEDATRVGIGNRRGEAASLLASTFVLPTLQLAAHTSWNYDQSGADRAATLSGGGDVSAALLPTLHASGSASANRRIVGEGGGQLPPVTFATLSAQIVAALRPELTATLQGDAQRTLSGSAEDTGTGTIPRIVVYQQYQLTLAYRPTSQLDLSARGGYLFTSVTGFVGGLHLNWSPFPGSAVQLGLGYDVNYDLITGNRARSLFGFARWNMNPHAHLDVNYTELSNSGVSNGTIRQFYVALGLTT